MSPFAGKNVQEVMENNKKCIVEIPPESCTEISEQAKDVIRLMTLQNPKERPQSYEILKHPWFTTGLNNTSTLVNAIENMKRYRTEYIVF